MVQPGEIFIRWLFSLLLFFHIGWTAAVCANADEVAPLLSRLMVYLLAWIPLPPLFCLCVCSICILLLAPPALFWMPSCVICSSSHLGGVPLVYHNSFYFLYSIVFKLSTRSCIHTFPSPPPPCFSFFPQVVIILGFSFIYVPLYTRNCCSALLVFCTLSLEFYSYPTPAFRSYSNLL